jgi:ribosomal protein S18 acetylase RimI-like enzyme
VGTRGGHPLDNPAMSALTGPHAHLAERFGQAACYPEDACPFMALPLDPDQAAWDDLAVLLGEWGVAATAGVSATPPAAGWRVLSDAPGVQLVGDRVRGEPDAEAVPLGLADVPEMLALAARTQPGPFLPRAIELGSFLGIRRGGNLIAMAGERLHPPGWVEISAVCTDAGFRRQGLASRLVRAVAAGISERGETPFLHVASSNPDAIRLYEQLGFRVRRPAQFVVARVRTAQPAAVG